MFPTTDNSRTLSKARYRSSIFRGSVDPTSVETEVSIVALPCVTFRVGMVLKASSVFLISVVSLSDMLGDMLARPAVVMFGIGWLLMIGIHKPVDPVHGYSQQ